MVGWIRQLSGQTSVEAAEDDLEFPDLGVCCSNCGFLAVRRWSNNPEVVGLPPADHEAAKYSNWREGLFSSDANPEMASIHDRRRGLLDVGRVGSPNEVSEVHCWVRPNALEREAWSISEKKWLDPLAVEPIVHLPRDTDSPSYCSKFTPWMQHIRTFQEHWEERKVYLLERDRKKFSKQVADSANRTQALMAGLVALGIIASVALSVCGTQTMVVKGVVPVSVETPAIRPAVTPQSSPSTSADQP